MSSQPYFSRQSQLLLVAGVAAAGTGAVLDGVAATDTTDEDSTAVVDFTALGITDLTVAGAGSLEDFFPGGSRPSFLSSFPTLGTVDTDMDTATVQATGMAADTLVKALGTAVETQVKATQNRQDPTRQRPWRVC